MSHLKHKLLVASSSMGDSDFTNAVILLLEHDETQGAYGVVINRKGEVPPDSEKQPFPVYVGGPCEMNKRITILHGIRRLSNKKLRIVPGLWYGTPKTLERALTLPLDDHRFKVLTGCAGWRAGQLEKEIAVAPGTSSRPRPNWYSTATPTNFGRACARSTRLQVLA